MAAEVQQFASADDRVRHIQPDAHVTVRQNRTILNHCPVIHLAKTLYVAEARDQSILTNVRSPADVAGSDHTRATMQVGSIVNPNARLNLPANRCKLATSLKRINYQTA